MNRQDAKIAKIRQEPDRKSDQLVFDVIGTAIEVHRELGPGFMESIYEEAICVELTSRRIPFVRQAPANILYKSSPVGEGRIDLWVAESLIVELKAVEQLAPINTAQVVSYLKATGCCLGLLLSFNVSIIKDGVHRVVLSSQH